MYQESSLEKLFHEFYLIRVNLLFSLKKLYIFILNCMELLCEITGKKNYRKN
jgi:hypothetical protein